MATKLSKSNPVKKTVKKVVAKKAAKARKTAQA